MSEARLTPRQVYMLQLAANGFCNKEIAGILGRSLKTVKNQFYDVNQRLGTRNRTHAAVFAWVHRWIK